MQSEKLIFKPLVETPEGKLVSVWAGGGGGTNFKVLEYKEGEITYTPPETPGIWVSKSLEEARSVGESNKNKSGTLVVYEVLALGHRMPDFFNSQGLRSCFSNDVRYPAILLGKKVWRDEPEPPKREWEDITSVCHLEFRKSQHCNGHYIAIMYGMKQTVIIGSAGMIAQHGFKIKKAPLAYTSFQVSKKVR